MKRSQLEKTHLLTSNNLRILNGFRIRKITMNCFSDKETANASFFPVGTRWSFQPIQLRFFLKTAASANRLPCSSSQLRLFLFLPSFRILSICNKKLKYEIIRRRRSNKSTDVIPVSCKRSYHSSIDF